MSKTKTLYETLLEKHNGSEESLGKFLKETWDDVNNPQTLSFLEVSAETKKKHEPNFVCGFSEDFDDIYYNGPATIPDELLAKLKSFKIHKSDLQSYINNDSKQLHADIDESATSIEDKEVEKDEMLEYERKASRDA